MHSRSHLSTQPRYTVSQLVCTNSSDALHPNMPEKRFRSHSEVSYRQCIDNELEGPEAWNMVRTCTSDLIILSSTIASWYHSGLNIYTCKNLDPCYNGLSGGSQLRNFTVEPVQSNNSRKLLDVPKRFLIYGDIFWPFLPPNKLTQQEALRHKTGFCDDLKPCMCYHEIDWKRRPRTDKHSISVEAHGRGKCMSHK